MTPEQIKKWREQAYALSLRSCSAATSPAEWSMLFDTEFARLVAEHCAGICESLAPAEASARKFAAAIRARTT